MIVYVILCLLTGCASGTLRTHGADVQQVTGQVATGDVLRNAALDVAGYRSEFGVGAVLVVLSVLLLTLLLSHRREVLRIKHKKQTC